MKLSLSFLIFLAGLILFSGCNDKNNLPSPPGTWDNSVFIVNEGPFQNGSGSIIAFNRESGEVTSNIFETVNGRPLGNIVQSMTIYKDKAFIVVNNSGKIEVVDLVDFKSVATIENLVLPRYFIVYNDQKAYVSCWDSTIKVINLSDYSILKSIKSTTGPDKMVITGKRLFVINTGGFETDSTISVINTDNDELIDLIPVGDRPSGIQEDANGKIWVLCSGKGYPGYPAPGDTRGRLVCIDPVSFEINKVISFPDPEIKPENLVINENGTRLFYQYPDGIFAFSISDTVLNTLPIITHINKFYGIGYDKVTKMIMGADPLNYLQNGWVFRYNGLDGTPVDSFMVGVIPSGFCFN
jgi:YVTN family beta-propeller protein